MDWLKDLRLPRCIKVKQKLISAPLQEDIGSKVRHEIETTSLLSRIRKGSKVAIGVGSRGIDRLDEVVMTVVGLLKEIGAEPFIVPAMGSHGGATAEGQKQILESYGITEQRVGVPIISSLEVVRLGETPEGVPVYFDKATYESDAVIAINRVKLHTSVSGEIESGVLKLLAIGFGKQRGAATLHRYDFENLSQMIVEAARVIIEKAPVALGIALLEDGYGQLCEIKAMDPEDIEKKENPSINIPIRSLSNIVYDEKTGMLKLGEKSSKRFFFHVGHAKKFMQTMLVAAFCKQLLDENIHTSLRDLFYALKRTLPNSQENTFDEQSESDPIVVDLEVMLDVLREQLHLNADVRGRVAVSYTHLTLPTKA